MPDNVNQAQVLDSNAKAAMARMYELFDKMSDGALSKGFRIPSDAERIKEWDGLPPEIIQRLRATKGDAWVINQQMEINKLRKEVMNNQ